VRVAIAGLGTIGLRHLATLSRIEGVDVVALADPRVDTRASQPEVAWFPSFDELLECAAGLDAVVICTPSWLHAEQTRRAAEHGLHAIVEKPLATTLEDADAALAAARLAGVHVAVLHQYRFHLPIIALRQMLTTGALGDLVFLNVALYWRRDAAYYRKDGGWRGTWDGDGGGALSNQGAHAVDLLRWLGGPVAQVSAHMTNVVHPIEAEDSVGVAASFRGGGLGSIQVTTCAGDNRPAVVHVQGTRTSATVQGQSLVLHDEPGTAAVAAPPGRPLSAHENQFREIVRRIGCGEVPPVAGDDARETLALTLAMYESARRSVAMACETEAGWTSQA
jgi:UDP-N-acetyl-2-amino-2-deoxyglucuronate dehydrogenase